MAYNPLGNRVVVKRKEQTTETASGIIIPDVAQNETHEGVVTAVGDGKRNKAGALIPLDVSVGDTVVFDKNAGAEITVGGDSVVVLLENDILCVMGQPSD